MLVDPIILENCTISIKSAARVRSRPLTADKGKMIAADRMEKSDDSNKKSI